jgi:hypothetical protein
MTIERLDNLADPQGVGLKHKHLADGCIQLGLPPPSKPNSSLTLPTHRCILPHKHSSFALAFLLNRILLQASLLGREGSCAKWL